MKILVTGANGDIGEATGRILQEAFPDADISGADASGQWPGGFIFKRMLQVPLASNPSFLNHLQGLAEEFDLIIPTSEPELARLSQISDIRSQLPLVMVDPGILKVFMDKYDTVVFFERNGLKAPKTKLFTELEYADLPVYVKPRKGAGGRGHRLVRTKEEFLAAKQAGLNDWVAQEYLPGVDNEYTCALFRHNRNLRSLILKRQLQGGKTVKAEVVYDDEIDKLLNRIAEIIDLDGCINVQLRMTEDGPMVFEINPRLSSTVMMRHKLGFKDCLWWVKGFLGMEIGNIIPPAAGRVAYRMSAEYVVPE
jgi:carbamoyl-phosphate synthase large subunit